MPAAVFVNIYETTIEMDVLGQIILFIVLFIGSQMILGSVLAKLLKLERKRVRYLKIQSFSLILGITVFLLHK